MAEPNVFYLEAARARAEKAPPYDGRSDDELMVLARGGEREALAVLAGRYTAQVTNFCAKLTRDPRASEELAQDTWLQVWAGRYAYEPRGKFAVFLYTIARNRCRNHVRAQRRRGAWPPLGASPDVSELASGGPDHLDALLARERGRRVHEALFGLPEKLREAIVLRFVEGLSYEDMASVLGGSESTLRSRVHHALKSLRSELERG
jgi:RNA polymerase sigma-70 factor, ECF subfamily